MRFLLLVYTLTVCPCFCRRHTVINIVVTSYKDSSSSAPKYCLVPNQTWSVWLYGFPPGGQVLVRNRLGFRIWQCFFPNPLSFVISYKFLLPIVGLNIFLSLLVYWSLLIQVSYGSERSDWTHVQVLHESFLFLIIFILHWSPRIVNNISLPIIYIRHPVARISEKNWRYYKVVQIWPGQTVTCLHTDRPGYIWTTLYSLPITRNKSVLFFANYLSTVSSKPNVCILWHTYASCISLPNFRLCFFSFERVRQNPG